MSAHPQPENPKEQMKMKRLCIVVASFMAVLGASVATAQVKTQADKPAAKPAKEANTQSHAPTKKDIERSIDRADQKKGQSELKAEQEKNRPKSDAEKATDKIPAQTTPGVITDPGYGVKITTPIKP